MDVEGKRIFDLVKFRLTVRVLIENADSAVQRAGKLVQRHDIRANRQSVENDHLAARQLVHDQRAEVGIITHYGGPVSEHHFLRDLPFLRHFLIKVTDKLHSVQLHDHALGMMLLQQRGKLLRCDFVLLDDLGIDLLIRIGGDVIFLLALLTDEQKRAFPGVKAGVAQRLLNELRFAGIQKAGKRVNRNRHCHASLHAEQSGNGGFVQL